MLLAALGMVLAPLQNEGEGRLIPPLCSSARERPAEPDDKGDPRTAHACALTTMRMEEEDAEG